MPTCPIFAGPVTFCMHGLVFIRFQHILSVLSNQDTFSTYTFSIIKSRRIIVCHVAKYSQCGRATNKCCYDGVYIAHA